MAARRALAAVLAVLALGGGAYLAAREAGPPAVGTAAVRTGKAVEAVYATATVEPVNWAAVSPLRTARIVSVAAEEGDAVKAGDVLALMDDADLRARLDEARARLSYSSGEMGRAEELFGAGHMARNSYDARKADLLQARANVTALEQQIRQMALAAPLDGIVLWRDGEPGEVKEAGKAVFWIGQPRPLRLDAEVDEEDAPKIVPGQKVLSTADAFPGEVMEGAVSRVTPKGDPVSKSYRVYADLPAGTKLMIGMTVESNIVVREKENALLVPREALAPGPSLWIAAGGAARRAPVRTGITGEDFAEILEGAGEGDLVILPPFDGLEDGAPVRAEAPAP